MLTVNVSIHRFGKEPEVARKRGLVAPAGGKINNMAEENIEGVFLTPGDIAGAAVKDQEIGKLTANQLKFCLKCKGLTKAETNRLSTKGYRLVVPAVLF